MKRALAIALLPLFFSFPSKGSTEDPKSLSPDSRADAIYYQVDALAADAKWRKETGALIGIAMGAGFAATGGILLASNTYSTDQTLGIFGLAFGAGMMIGGSLALVIETPLEKRAAEIFGASAKLTGQARLDSYEKTFGQLAARAKQQRLTAASLITALGVGATVLGVVTRSNQNSYSYNATGSTFLILGPALALGGVALFFLQEPHEYQYDSIKKTGVIASESTGSLRLGLAPIAEGAMLVSSLRF